MLGGRRCRLVLAAGVAGAVTPAPAAAALASAAAPADTVRVSQQWVLDMLDVQPAWLVTKGAGVTVAVLDSGVDPNVTDLTRSVITRPDLDLTGLHTSPANPHWGEHG